MDTGSTALTDLKAEIEATAGNAYLKAILCRNEDGWSLYHARALIGAEPPGWAEQAWRYERLTFAAWVLPAAELAGLCAADGSVITLSGLPVSVPGVLGPANWTMRPSFARHDHWPLPWPVTDYRISAADAASRQLPHEILVGDGPSFPEPQSAWRAFCEGDFSLTGAQAPPQELALLRFTRLDGWVGRVHVTPAELTADVRGGRVAGCELELYGEAGRSSYRLAGPGTVAFPLDNGLPASAWLWLKQGTSWLDYRSIDTRSGWTGDLACAGVEFDLPVDLQASVEALLAAGEGPQVEYKRQLPDTAEQKRRTLKTTAAFATQDGGTIVFGIDPDELTVTGLGDQDSKSLRDRLYALVHGTVVPPPGVTVTDHQIDGKTILVLDVPPGPEPPYGLAVDKGSRDKPEFYIRRGSSTYPAQPGELRRAARSRPPAEGTGGRRTPFGPW
jgi:hypothetical protein